MMRNEILYWEERDEGVYRELQETAMLQGTLSHRILRLSVTRERAPLGSQL